jgi:hypothetical protein
MNAELSRPDAHEAAVRPREHWPAWTLGTMMVLIVVLSVHLVAVSARAAETGTAETYADGSGTIATLGLARIAVGGQ